MLSEGAERFNQGSIRTGVPRGQKFHNSSMSESSSAMQPSVQSKFEPLVLKKSGGLDDAKWFRLPDILDLNFYDDMLPIVTAAVQKLLDKSSR